MLYACTSRIDAVVRIFIGLPLLFATIFSAGAAIHFLIPLRPLGVSNSAAEWVEGIGGIVVGAIIYHRLIAIQIQTLSSFLYLRLALWTPVSWAEARFLAPLFVLTEQDTWLPLSESRKLPREERKSYIYHVGILSGRLSGQKDINSEQIIGTNIELKLPFKNH